MKLRNPGDWIIAAVVLLCSIVLFLALSSALHGSFLGRMTRTVEADFPDVTGVLVNSEVRFAGARAGIVTGVRMLTPEERLASGRPGDAVRLTMSLFQNVPPLTAGTSASITSDTILSDKFVLLTPGDPAAKPLEPGTVLAGVAPVTLDAFLRRADGIITALDDLLGPDGDMADPLKDLRAALDETRALIREATRVVGEAGLLVEDAAKLPGEVRPVLADFRSVTGDAGALLAELRPSLNRAVANLEGASASLDRLARDGSRFLTSNERELTALLAELRTTAQNAKIAATYARIFAASITRNPSQLIWGTRRPPRLPSKEEILNSRQPVPVQ